MWKLVKACIDSLYWFKLVLIHSKVKACIDSLRLIFVTSQCVMLYREIWKTRKNFTCVNSLFHILLTILNLNAKFESIKFGMRKWKLENNMWNVIDFVYWFTAAHFRYVPMIFRFLVNVSSFDKWLIITNYNNIYV